MLYCKPSSSPAEIFSKNLIAWNMFASEIEIEREFEVTGGDVMDVRDWSDGCFSKMLHHLTVPEYIQNKPSEYPSWNLFPALKKPGIPVTPENLRVNPPLRETNLVWEGGFSFSLSCLLTMAAKDQQQLSNESTLKQQAQKCSRFA